MTESRTSVTICEIDYFDQLITKHGLKGCVYVYSRLIEKGFEYASWAKGVATGENLTGEAAVIYMKEKYAKDHNKKELSDEVINNIRIDMTKGYLEALRKNIKEDGGSSTKRDITYEQAREFHKDKFEKNQLTIDSWTLEAPMNLIGHILGGDEAKEKVWQELMKTQGDGLDSWFASFDIKGLLNDVGSRGWYYVDISGKFLDISESLVNGSIYPHNIKKIYITDEKLLAGVKEWSDIATITNGFTAAVGASSKTWKNIFSKEELELDALDIIICPIENDLSISLYKAECFVCDEVPEPWFFDSIPDNILPAFTVINTSASTATMTRASWGWEPVNPKPPKKEDTCTSCMPIDENEIMKLPNISALGKVLTLHEAMKKDLVLKQMVEDYFKRDISIDTLSYEDDTKLYDLIYRWTKSDQAPVVNRGVTNTKILISLEELMNKPYKGSKNSKVSQSGEWSLIFKEFKEFANYVKAHFLLHKKENFFIYEHLLKVMSQNTEKPEWTEFFADLKSFHQAGNIKQAQNSYFILKNILKYSSKYKDSLDIYLFNNIDKYLEDFENGLHINPTQSYNNHINNIILGTENKDKMIAHEGLNYLSGKNGDDEIQGGAGIDVLNGGKGNDKLRGGDNSIDYYVFTPNHGHDTVFDRYIASNEINYFNFLFANSADVKFTRIGQHLIIQAYQDKNNSVTLYNFFENALKSKNQFFEFKFSDKTLTADDLKNLPLHEIHGTPESERLTAWLGSSQLYGHDGDDSLFGGLETDYLDGGKGNDHLYGDEGADTYVFSKGHGKDMIYDSRVYVNHEPSGETNKILFVDANFSEAKFIKLKNNLAIYAYDNKEDAVILMDYYSSNWQTKSKAYEIQFMDKTIDSSELENTRVLVFMKENSSSLFPNHLNGSWHNDEIYGSDKNDSIYAEDGDDIIIGGKGRDIIRGDSGDDIFVLNDLESHDIIEDFMAWDDKIRLDKNVFTVFNNHRIENHHFYKGEIAKTAEHHLIFNPKNHQLFYDVDGNGNEAPIHIATINGFFPEKNLSYYHFEIL